MDGHEGVLVGLVGEEIAASRSPRMHQEEADTQGFRLIYRLFDRAAPACAGAGLDAILSAANILGFAGLNVTHPYKQAVMPLLDHIDPAAARVGAVNTVVFRDGLSTGFNTDAEGFAEGLMRGLGERPLGRVAQIGAGGAGAAVASALAGLGCSELRIVDSDHTRAQTLAERINAGYAVATRALTNPAEALNDADGLVNATPVGMTGHTGTPVDDSLIRSTMWVADVVYFPRDTELLRRARAKGCTTIDGSAMAVFQAARAFELFTGRVANRERMLAAFEVA